MWRNKQNRQRLASLKKHSRSIEPMCFLSNASNQRHSEWTVFASTWVIASISFCHQYEHYANRQHAVFRSFAQHVLQVQAQKGACCSLFSARRHRIAKRNGFWIRECRFIHWLFATKRVIRSEYNRCYALHAGKVLSLTRSKHFQIYGTNALIIVRLNSFPFLL